MKLKGFILEDGQGREFVMVCERSHMRGRKTFALRGWQRRRLVPLHYTERELRQIIRGVMGTLNDLFKSLPRGFDGLDSDFSVKTSSVTHVSRKTRKIDGDPGTGGRNRLCPTTVYR